MTLANKYLKYSPEITLEIFELVWNKLIELGFKHRCDNKLHNEFKCFKDKRNCLIVDDIYFNTYTSLCIVNELEITVQEILGYDPFVKEEFVLPEKWCIKIKANGIPEEVAQWRKSSWSSPGYMLNSGMWDCNNAIGYTEITFDQFKKYVLKQNVEKGKVVIPEYVELLEGFDNTCTGKIFDTNQPIPQMSGWDSKWTWESIFKNNIQRSYFKPSTKEAFDAQKKPKQPLKQAVHCKTQEEWDFVTEKLGYKWSKYSEWSSYKNNTCINLNKLGFGTAGVAYKGYQILSFQEWCDLNGYKMGKEVKFEVGKWYICLCNKNLYKCSGNSDTNFYHSEAINPTNRRVSNIEPGLNKTNSTEALIEYFNSNKLASIEEIQQYLPDSHPDKIKVDREFKVGEYIFVMTKGRCYRDILKVTSVKSDEKDSGIKGTVWIKHENSSFSGGGFRLGSKYRYNEHVRHATPEEINNHLISIEQIPAGEPLNTGIEPNKDGMFKYKQTMPGASWSGGTIDNHLDVMIPTTGNSYNKDFSTSIIPVKSISVAIEFNYLPEPK